MSGYLVRMRDEGSKHANNLKVFEQSNRYLSQSSLCPYALICFLKIVTAIRHMGSIPRRYIAKRKAGVLPLIARTPSFSKIVTIVQGTPWGVLPLQ